MTAKNQNFSMYDGETKVLTITMNPIKDLTSATIDWFLTTINDPSTAVVTKSIGSGITVTDLTNGVFDVTVDPADTEGLEGKHLHWVRVVDGNSDDAVVTTGAVKITASPT